MTDADTKDFNNFVGGCDVMQIQHKDSPFTWWNGRVGDGYIFERHDRIFSNSNFQGLFSHWRWSGYLEMDQIMNPYYFVERIKIVESKSLLNF